MKALKERDGALVEISAKLELIKKTQPNKDDSWNHRILGFLEARRRAHQPLYIKRAFERHPISGHTGSLAAFGKVCSWFHVCSTSHQACGDNHHPPSLPTRVIDIADRNNMRLVECYGSESHYVCLSHRWMDEKKMPRCTRANIDSLKQHIPWDSLTQSFQDAITFTQEFSRWYTQRYPDQDSTRYMWIDSLCIIQDSAQDWDNEARLMCSTYEGAILTVAAASAMGGCFSEAEKVFKGFEVSNPRRPNTKLYLRKGLPNHGKQAIEGMSDIADAFSDGLDLFTRGWVLQERLLSRRFLIFSPNEIMWECFEISDCECGRLSNGIEQETVDSHKEWQYEVSLQFHKFDEQQRAEDRNYPMSPMPFKVAYHKSLEDGNEYRMRNLRDWWRRLVATYSSLSLTKESDRLPALMGLAAQFGRTTGIGDYISGHWMSSLPFDLIWYTDTLAGRIFDQDQPHPISSWSWASCASPVRMPMEASPDNFIECATLNSVSPTLGSSVSLNLRCSIFTGSTDDLNNNNFPILSEYFPDSASHPMIPTHERIYALIMSSISSEFWCFLHIQTVSQSKLKFRRLGMFLLSRRGNIISPQKEAITDLTVRSCFETEVVQDIALI